MIVKKTLYYSISLLDRVAQDPDGDLVWSGERIKIPVLKDLSTHPNQNQPRGDPENVQERFVKPKDVLGIRLVVWKTPYTGFADDKFHIGLRICFTKDIQD